MAKPSTVPTWATDTNIATGTEAGTPTKVAPAAGFLAQGLVPGDTFVGPYFNYLLNLITTWIAYLNLSGTDELTYANTRTRTVLVPLYHGVGIVNLVTDPSGKWTTNDDGSIESDTTAGVWRTPFVIPDGAILTGVRVPGVSASATMQVYKRTYTNKTAGSIAKTTTQLGTTQTFAGTPGGSVAAVTGLSDTADAANKTYLITLTSTNVADAFEVAEVTYTETRATGSN